MKKGIYITSMLPGLSTLQLKKYFNVVVNNEKKPPERKELIKNIEGKYALLCTLNDKIDKEVIDSAGDSLKIISTYSTGYNHIDIDEATRKGIFVTYTGDILTEATADLTFGLILSVARRIPEAQEYLLNKKWIEGWSPDLFLGSNVYGMNLGILGLGKIGAAVAARASGFNMKIYYHNRNKLEESMEKKLGIEYLSIDDLFKKSDFLTIHTNLNKESYHLVNLNYMKMMKPTSFIINTSRGHIINEDDLIFCLKNKTISGAALDVYEKEPIKKNNPLIGMGNVVLLPHIGSATIQTRTKMTEVAVKNILDIVRGKESKYIVNRGSLNTKTKEKNKKL